MTDSRTYHESTEVLIDPSSAESRAYHESTEVMVTPADVERRAYVLITEVLIPVPPNPLAGPPLSLQSIAGNPVYILTSVGWKVKRSMNDPYV